MKVLAIRGATTVTSNNKEEILKETSRLIETIILKNELTYELDIIDIDLNKFNINNSKDVKKITRILGDICFINTDREYMLLSLFNSINKINNKILLDHFEILISNYIKNIKFLVEYHKLKESII